MIGGLYTKAAVVELEPKIDLCMKMFIDQMRKQTHEINPTNLDISLWVHLFSFDCLGELNVSKTFGFMETGKDFNGMIEGSDRILAITGLVSIDTHQGSVLLANKVLLTSANSTHKLPYCRGYDGSRKIYGLRKDSIPY